MDTEYFYHTPYMGRLMDPANFVPETGETTSRKPYIDNPIGESPKEAAGSGAHITGRIIHAMTMMSHVIVRNESTGKLSLRLRRGLAAMYEAVDYLNSHSDWEVINVGWQGEIETVGFDPAHAMPRGDTMLPLTEAEKETLREQLREATGSVVEPVWLPPPTSQWREYAEHTIWPTSHYMQSMDVEGIEQQAAGWDHYKEFNEAFAETITKIYRPGDVIWVHDYYLYLLPGMLRKRIPGATIGMFVHTPFPSSEFIRCIPQRAELLEGMLGSTMVGLQSHSYVRHFVSSCIRLLGNDHDGDNILVDGRVVTCKSLPIGIDTENVVAMTERQSSKDLVSEIRSLYAGKKVIIGRDKFDAANSVLQKLKAFALVLQAYPEWREKVVLVQITTPSYDQNTKDENKVAELVAEINGAYGTMQSWPIQHYSRHIAQDEYYALLEVADLGLFTGVRDSTSHAVLEYLCCQRKTGHKVIISEFMGLRGYLKDALVVNPYDAMSIANAINIGLSQGSAPESGRTMFELLTSYNVKVWMRTFLGDLVQHDLEHESKHHTPQADTQDLTMRYHRAKNRLFLFDYDGTLTPIVRDPAAAVPSERMKRIFKNLCDDPKNEVWIISGRDQKFLDQHMGHYYLSMSAEHGSFVKKRGEKEWTDLVAAMDNSWQKIVLEVLQSYTERTQGSIIERKKASITWHYRRADPVFGAFQASHLRAYLELAVAQAYPVDVMSGKANVEVRPHMFNKGEIVRTVFKEAPQTPDFVLCMGDDTTDEDMFKAVGEQRNDDYFSVVVGPSDKLTIAQLHIQNPHKVHDALEAMIEG